MFQSLWLFKIASLVHTIGIYSVIGPGTIRSNFKCNVVISVHEADQSCLLKVSVTGPSYNETKIVEVQPGSTQNVEFDIPTLQFGEYYLNAVGLEGIVFENSTLLNYVENNPLIFIQTDKASYKPGDMVRFRAVFLDEHLRPAKIDEPINILIKDGAQNIINQLSNVSLTTGVYFGELRLSDHPVLGTWNIEVNFNGENPTSKFFGVAKYVLPKFDVSIETAKNPVLSNGVIKVTVRSKYTYGKSVKGKATVSIKPSSNYYYYGGGDNNLHAEKTADVDGKGHVEFDLSEDLRFSTDLTYIPPLTILVVMEEALTGKKENTSTTVKIHRSRFRIESVDTPYNYQPDIPIVYTVVVKKVDGSPVQDTENSAKLVLDAGDHYYLGRIQEDSTTTHFDIEAKLDKSGMTTFNFTLPKSNTNYYMVKCNYLDTTVYLSSLSISPPVQETTELLKISVKTPKPQLLKELSVEVQFREASPYFFYTIVARGNIVKSELVERPAGSMSHDIQFMPTLEMVPKATIFVYYVHDSDLRFEESTINFEKEFENSIEISATEQAKPGDEVSLKIHTDPNSFVGLLGVDQSVLLLKSGNDFNKDDIFSGLSNFNSSTPWIGGHGRYPGQMSGLVTMTNANFQYDFRESTVLLPAEYTSSRLPLKCRTTSQNHEENSSEGYTVSQQLPDTITSWVITGFSLNPRTGFALTKTPNQIRAFQPFFITINLPYSIKRGEVIAVPVIIFNYMEKTLDAEITMDNTDKEYDFTEATNKVEDSPIDELKCVKRVTIPSNSGQSVSFMIRPKVVGPISLKIGAVTQLAGDAIHQTLNVEPEGVTQYENRAVFINLNDSKEHSDNIAVEIPSEAVKDSEYIEFSVVGDLLGPTIKNLDQLVRMPYGCGEQNMVNFVPNILVLKYLDTVNQNSPTITEKAKQFLEIGYQREMSFRNSDGSYSAFGNSNQPVSTWLTAYVTRFFLQAEQYTYIDTGVIDQGLLFLVSIQAGNGSFPEYGKLFDLAYQNELGLTSFVLLSFLENAVYKFRYQSQIDKAVEFIVANIDSSDDPYSLSIAALVLQLVKNPSGKRVLVKLEGLSKKKHDKKWWSKDLERPWDVFPNSNDVEITAYVALALMVDGSPDVVLPIIKWLIAQRNGNGGFLSTQDTVVGLQALIKFAEKTGYGNGEMHIDFTSYGAIKTKGSFRVNPKNSLVMQTSVLSRDARRLKFTAKGGGSAVLQLSYRYNIAEVDKQPSFLITTIVKDSTPLQQLMIEICVMYAPINQRRASNMAIMEVALPSGYTADTERFGDIESVEGIDLVQTAKADSILIVYFTSLLAGAIKCLPVQAWRNYAVARLLPAAVTVYDYYETSVRATAYYEVHSSLCDICEGKECGIGC